MSFVGSFAFSLPPRIIAELWPRDSPVTIVALLLVLLAAVAALARLARRLGLPYPILLVIGGLGLSLVPELPRLRLDPELVFVLFLPPLLYPAALFTPWRDFHANLAPILSLAIGLVLVTIVVTAWCAHTFIGLSWGAAWVLGAIIAPSDAVAATAIAHRLRVPRRLVTILEGESLVNDAAAFVAYRFAIAAVVTGAFSLGQATEKFVIAAAGGTLVGLAFGWLVTSVQRRLDDPPVQITVSLLTPFATYLATEALGCSGVLAVVVCGLFYGWRAPEVVGARFRLRAQPVWEMIVFILNGTIFILIGLQLPDVLASFSGHHWTEVLRFALLILVPVVALRLAWLFGIAYLPPLLSQRLRRRFGRTPWRHVALIGWTGMRGVDSLAAALAVPLVVASGAPFPDRDMVFFLTFAVIFGTLVVQGLTLTPMIRWLGVVDDRVWEKEERHARLEANEAALARLRALSGGARPLEKSALHRLVAEYEDRIRHLKTAPAEDNEPAGGLFSKDYEQLSQEALDTERRTILELRNRRVINDEALRRIQHDIDLAEIRLHQDAGESSA